MNVSGALVTSTIFISDNVNSIKNFVQWGQMLLCVYVFIRRCSRPATLKKQLVLDKPDSTKQDKKRTLCRKMQKDKIGLALSSTILIFANVCLF